MTRPILGTAGGKPLAIDVERLLETRALLTASSGWGKSWALRRVIEQTHGRGAMQLVIDPEGEFASLREKFDFVIAGKGGDCPAEPRSADLLARRLLELGASAVLDLYELRATGQHVPFVRRFLEALVSAPKALWRPILVVIDEAHMFAPEKGEAESRDAVRGLMTLGRKRGFAGLLATQRLAKLDKDSCDAGNVMVGRYTLDVDVKRAGESIGFEKARFGEIKRLGRGEFFVYGPALSEDLVRVEVGDVVTTHPKAGARHVGAAPAPREKVQRVLAKLADLPKEAEAEARSSDELRAQLRLRDRELGQLKRDMAQAVAGAVVADPEALERARSEGRNEVAQGVAREAKQLVAGVVASAEGGRRRAAAALDQALVELKRVGERIDAAADALREPIEVPESRISPQDYARDHARPAQPRAAAQVRTISPKRGFAPENTPPAEGMTAREQRVLDALAWWAAIGVEAPDKGQVGFIAGYRVGKSVGGTFGNILGRLRGLGLIDYPNGAAALTDAGRAIARPPDEHPTTEALQRAVRDRLDGRESRVLQVLIDAYPDPLSKQECGERAGYTVGPSVGGTFGNILGRLRSLGLIDYPSGQVVALPVLFLEQR